MTTPLELHLSHRDERRAARAYQIIHAAGKVGGSGDFLAMTGRTESCCYPPKHYHAITSPAIFHSAHDSRQKHLDT